MAWISCEILEICTEPDGSREGDSVVARLTFTGTHTGMLSIASRTLPATEKPFSVREIIVFRLVEGKIREIWPVWDRLSLLEQLGTIST